MPGVRLGGAFRRRLTIAFVVVVAVSGGLLAVTSYVLIKEYRTRSFIEQSLDEAALSLISTPDDLSLTDVDQLLAEFQRRGGFETVLVAGDVVFSSQPTLGTDGLPPGMASQLRPGELDSRTAEVGGDTQLVVAGVTPSGTSQVFFLFSEEELRSSIADFRNVLALGWLLSVVTAALFGNLVARRTLRPVAEAAQASQSLAEGLLDTRLESSSQDEFGRWASSFNEMADALQAKMQDLSSAAERERRFTANVAHELRTPLTGMVSAASLLGDDLASLPPETVPAARLLIDDVHRLKVLVTELLELARLDAGQEEAHLEPLSVGDALRAVTRPWDGSTSVRLAVDGHVVAMADRARFRRVVANLVHNAVEHGGDGVEVRGYRDADRAVIEVRDHGRGIADDDLDRLFDRFFKADRSRSTGGSGLGLSIALANARLQDGSITARNLDGGGACFTFTLPAVDSQTRPTEVRQVRSHLRPEGARSRDDRGGERTRRSSPPPRVTDW